MFSLHHLIRHHHPISHQCHFMLALSHHASSHFFFVSWHDITIMCIGCFSFSVHFGSWGWFTVLPQWTNLCKLQSERDSSPGLYRNAGTCIYGRRRPCGWTCDGQWGSAHRLTCLHVPISWTCSIYAALRYLHTFPQSQRLQATKLILQLWSLSTC